MATFTLIEAKKRGFDVERYLVESELRHGRQTLNTSKLERDKDKIALFLKEHYPNLLVLDGYDPYMNPIYSIGLFTTFLDYWFLTGVDELRNKLFDYYEFKGTHQVLKKV